MRLNSNNIHISEDYFVVEDWLLDKQFMNFIKKKVMEVLPRNC